MLPALPVSHIAPGSSLLPKQFSNSREIKIEKEWLSTRKINFEAPVHFNCQRPRNIAIPSEH